MTSQRIGKYACLEIESRYLLRRIPDDLLEHPKGWLITDRYLPDTRLLIGWKVIHQNEQPAVHA